MDLYILDELQNFSSSAHEPVVVGLAGMVQERPGTGLAGMDPAEICNYMQEICRTMPEICNYLPKICNYMSEICRKYAIICQKYAKNMQIYRLY